MTSAAGCRSITRLRSASPMTSSLVCRRRAQRLSRWAGDATVSSSAYLLTVWKRELRTARHLSRHPSRLKQEENHMRTIEYRVALLVAVLTSAPVLLTAAAAGAEPQAIAGTVSGNVQKVGFRAMILKQAIEYNLAGSARNNPDGTVQFSLQGDRNRI